MRTPLAVIAASVLAVFASACDHWPSAEINNDTATPVIAQSTDFVKDRAAIAPGETGDMAPLSDDSPGIYIITDGEGAELGCLKAAFARGQKSTLLRVSETRPCAEVIERGD